MSASVSTCLGTAQRTSLVCQDAVEPLCNGQCFYPYHGVDDKCGWQDVHYTPVCPLEKMSSQ